MKINLDYKHIFNYLIIVILLINIPAAYFTYKYIKANLYDAIFFQQDENYVVKKSDSEDINIPKIQNIFDKIEKKSVQTDLQNIKNIFKTVN